MIMKWLKCLGRSRLVFVGFLVLCVESNVSSENANYSSGHLNNLTHAFINDSSSSISGPHPEAEDLGSDLFTETEKGEGLGIKYDFDTFAAYIGPRGLITKHTIAKRQLIDGSNPLFDPHFPEESCYGLSSERLNWYEAQDVCRSGFGDLLSIESKEEDSFIVNWIREENNIDDFYWTSGSDRRSENWYQWEATCLFMRYRRFGPNNNNDNFKDMFMISIDATPAKFTNKHQGWYLIHFKNKARYICERQINQCRVLFPEDMDLWIWGPAIIGPIPGVPGSRRAGGAPEQYSISERERIHIQSMRTAMATSFKVPQRRADWSKPLLDKSNKAGKRGRRASWPGKGGRITPGRPFDDRCYYFSMDSERYAWATGRDMCAYNEKGSLVDMETQREFDFLAVLMSQHWGRRRPLTERYWTSGNDQFTEGFIRWETTCENVEGIIIHLQKWTPWIKRDEVDFGNAPNLDCIAYEWNADPSKYGWILAPCSDEYRIICKSQRTYCHHARYMDGLVFPWVNLPTVEFPNITGTFTYNDAPGIAPNPVDPTDPPPTKPTTTTTTPRTTRSTTTEDPITAIPRIAHKEAKKARVESSLGGAICDQMTSFNQAKQIQEPLKSKTKFARGQDTCSYYMWNQCQSGHSCPKFTKKRCEDLHHRKDQK